MKYKCLIFDHDDTVVNSTATIHFPCFELYLQNYLPDRKCTLEEYFIKNFSPGFVPMCKQDYGLSDEDLEVEVKFWQDYVKDHIPDVYPGIREIMFSQKSQGGLLCVISHSMDYNIRRDYLSNGLPAPDAVYGWERPPEQRKPNPYPVEKILRQFRLSPDDVLVIDDLKPGFDMAKSTGVHFAAAGWANDIPQIESFMRQNCGDNYFKTVAELAKYLED